MKNIIELFKPDNFEAEDHFYPKALNSQLHPMVSHFLNLDRSRLIKRYKHLNPQVDEDKLEEILSYQCKYFFGEGPIFFIQLLKTEIVEWLF